MSPEPDNVIAFPGVRVAAAEPATLVIGAVLTEEPQVVHRQFGINDQLSLAQLSDALRIMFGWPGESAPVRFTLRDGGTVPTDTMIGDVLQDPGDTLTWHWGLWDHRLDVREAFARDEATPDALCIGGSGTIDGVWRARPGEPPGPPRTDGPDIAAINEELTGEQSIQRTLASAREDVVDLIERSGVFEFVPLLQALDLRRETGCGITAADAARMRALPVEDPVEDAAGNDAALATLLCLAALTDDDIRHDVTTHVMDSLGWRSDEGLPLTGEDVEALCAGTMVVLSAAGIVGDDAVPPIERLDLLREALRR